MARKKIQLATDQRPFIMVYQDFLESNILDNYYQRLVYIYLKKFADSKNQCYPSVKTISKQSGISVNKVKITLKELEEKGIIAKANRSRPDGGKSSNLYTLYDYRELWNAGSSEEVAAVIDGIQEKYMIEALTAKGYYVTKEKGLASEPTKAHTQAPQLNQFDIVNTTTNSGESQDLERYTLDQIKQLFDYDIMIQDNPYRQQDIDSVMNILYTTMNTTKATIRISGEDKPSMVVIGKLMKLSYSEIIYAIEKYQEQTERIKNPTSYMLTLLYNAKEQMNLDITNQVSHDMAHWNTEE
jgi:DNA-binding Lrp family transcriptional regulator